MTRTTRISLRPGSAPLRRRLPCAAFRRRLPCAALAASLAVLALAQAAPAAVPTGYNPNALPVPSCFWTGPFTAKNPKTNSAFPGTEITYWGAKFATPPGARLVLHGTYAHARYQSLNAYVDNGGSTNSLPDVRTRPDPGSTNPYFVGNRRDLPRRDYTVRVLGTAVPAEPAANTLYAQPDPAGDSYQDIIYRVYVPDKGRGPGGGAKLPVPELQLSGGGTLRGRALCEEINANHNYTSSLLSPALYDTLVNWPGKDPATNPAQPSPSFEKFFSIPYSLSFYLSPAEHAAADPTPVGAQYNNSDARYMTTSYAFDFGEVLALRGKMPWVPATYRGIPRMQKGQLREWDMCVIESLVTTRTYRCLFDEQIPLTAKRRYVIAVTRAADRPSNARHECGVAWLGADPAGDGAGRPDTGTLLTRNILPNPKFKKSSWKIRTPGTAEAVMGAYYPRPAYMSRAAFESHGCPFH